MQVRSSQSWRVVKRGFKWPVGVAASQMQQQGKQQRNDLEEQRKLNSALFTTQPSYFRHNHYTFVLYSHNRYLSSQNTGLYATHSTPRRTSPAHHPPQEQLPSGPAKSPTTGLRVPLSDRQQTLCTPTIAMTPRRSEG